jgi:hypothetical protein
MDSVDCSKNTRTSLKKHGTLAQVAKGLGEGAYVIIHKGHAFGLLVVDGKAFTVDYGKGNAARRIVWTCTQLTGLDARKLLNSFQNPQDRLFGGFSKGAYMEALERRVVAYTSDTNAHILKTAQDSREFVRAHGMDPMIPDTLWDEIHALQD